MQLTLHTPERASERATQFTGRFQAAPRLRRLSSDLFVYRYQFVFGVFC